MSEARVETVEEFLARGGSIEILEAPEIAEGRKSYVADPDVYSKNAAWRGEY